ncbi:MAG: 2-keto-4-pentenoate hydratase [Bacteroidota bacterium]|jgi:2-keto-4-pentenoate hydratase
MSSIKSLANSLFDALRSGQPIPPLRDHIDNNIEKAYAIQEELVNLRLDAGEKIVGKKIGLTSFAVQQQLGVDQPDYGVLFDTMNLTGKGPVPMELLMQPKVEGELAFILGEDLDGPEITKEELVAAISQVRASIEIVGSRVANWDIRISDTIADNASGSHFVLGSEGLPLHQVDTVGITMRLKRNGEIASEGKGVACMDDPLNAALWLANTMARNGRPLMAGEVLLSGALGPMVPVESGDFFTLEVDGFAPVLLSFE